MSLLNINQLKWKEALGMSRNHDDVIKWKHFPLSWPFVRGIHRSPVNSPHKGQWRGALMFSLIWAWINRWVNNCEANDLRRHHAHYDVIVMDKDVVSDLILVTIRQVAINVPLRSNCTYRNCRWTGDTNLLVLWNRLAYHLFDGSGNIRHSTEYNAMLNWQTKLLTPDLPKRYLILILTCLDVYAFTGIFVKSLSLFYLSWLCLMFHSMLWSIACCIVITSHKIDLIHHHQYRWLDRRKKRRGRNFLYDSVKAHWLVWKMH